ncbi:MAG: VWA domain-containing protein [Acidobacteriaceae bacterium]|nr:VWA domain-containing protein [Acidobacteriaceae bacterium]
MTFTHPWFLILIPLPLLWIALSRRAAIQQWSLLLKGLSFVSILIAMAEPVITLPETKTAVVVLADTSSSITRLDLAHASSFIAQMERHKHGNWMTVVPFASQTRPLLPAEVSRGVDLLPTRDETGNGTNLEAALTESMAAIPSGHMPRLVLMSDGKENEGSTARAIAELQRLHVPVDTVPLAGHPNTGFRLESLSMPREAYAGEQIPIDLTVDSPQDTHGSIEVFAEGKTLGTNPVEIARGINVFRVHAHVKSIGAISISGRISTGELGELPFEQPIQLRRAKVLYLSADPPGTETNLLQAFSEANFDLTRDASLVSKDLSTVQLIVLNNLDLNLFSAAQKLQLEEYVKNGGGLLLIGGERQVYKEDKQMDALDRVLPAKLAPPKTPQGTCVALIIDKSSSMEGRKIELARLSAIGVVDHLRPSDTIGVLIFDNSYQWAVPMRRAEDKSMIKRLISGITPDGGTQIAPALGEAYRKVLSSKFTYKHIVLLTDGISEEGDSIDLAREALQHQITISTVGLGQDVNRTYLEKVAETSGGRSYFLNEPQGLEQILLKDVQDYSGSTAVEKPLTPLVERDAEILTGVGMNTAPPLKGYARFTAKPAAETILSIDEQRKDPLYVRWQYGLGRAAVFTSDAKSRWAQAWVAWPGFDKFWINAARDLLAHTNQSEASAQFDTANNDIVVSYHLGPGVDEPAAPPQIFVIGPNHFEKAMDIRKTAPRLYYARLHTGRLRGLFRIRPISDSPAFPEIGLYRQQEELQDYGSDEPLLAQISTLTGGRFNPSPESVFDTAGRSIYTGWQLWPALLALAIALSIAELIIRKWPGLLEALHRR